MQFGLSEEQILLQDNVNRFLDDNSPLDRVRTYAEGGEDRDIWAGLAELGDRKQLPVFLCPRRHITDTHRPIHTPFEHGSEHFPDIRSSKHSFY